MLESMVATTELATIVSLAWIGGLSLVLVGRAVISWVAFRHATRSAARAREIAEATAPGASGIASPRRLARVIPLRDGPATLPPRSEAEA